MATSVRAPRRHEQDDQRNGALSWRKAQVHRIDDCQRRPLEPYDFVVAFDFAVSPRRFDHCRLRESSPEFNQPQLMQQKSPAFEPREDRGSLS
jgi:hypothetical protein